MGDSCKSPSCTRLICYRVLRSTSLDLFFFFHGTPTTYIYTLSLHDALPISRARRSKARQAAARSAAGRDPDLPARSPALCQFGLPDPDGLRSEEHTSELQSRQYLVCRLLLEKKKT